MVLLWLLLVVCSFVSTKAENAFVKPSETVICSSQPCLTFNNYVNQSNQYFVDNATFMFLAGVHLLDFPLNLENLSDVAFLTLDGELVEIVLSHSIIWKNCTNIKISDLNFNLSGKTQLEFSAIVFHQTKAFLSNVTVFGNGDQRAQALYLNDSSEIEANNLLVFGAISEQGAALYALNSTVDISGHSMFANNNVLSEGGAIALYDCVSNLCGMISFINNAAKRFNGIGGALVINGGNHTISGSLLFTDNVAFLNGGALVISGASFILILGSISFINNTSVYGMGGAIYMNGSSHDIISSNISFIDNTAPVGGAMALANGSYQVYGNLSFISNTATSHGGAIDILDGQHIISGTILFANNSVSSGFGGAVCTSSGSHNISGDLIFINNSVLAGIGGAIAFLFGSDNYFSGNISFVKNTAEQGGAMFLNSGSLNISGDVSFTENSARTYGGAIALFGDNNSISGNISFYHNVAFSYGGAVLLSGGNHSLSGLFAFTNNTVTNGSGGAISIFSNSHISGNISFVGNSAAGEGGAVAVVGVDIVVDMTGTQSFVKNSALRGGAIALLGSKMMLANPFQANFIENYAKAHGGAVFILVDTTTGSSECAELNPFAGRHEECLFEVDSLSNIRFNFSYNRAGSAGTVVYGGNFDTCRLYIGRVRDTCGRMIGGNFSDDPLRTIIDISNIVTDDNITSLISSDPLKVCICDGDNLECTGIDVGIVRGRKFTLQAVIVGQNEGTVPSFVRTSLDNGVRIDTEQRIQSSGKECMPVTYRLFYNGNATVLTLFPDNGVCRGAEAFRTRIHVRFLPCPDGFSLDGSACVCEERLQQFTSNCDVDDASIERSSNTFWMGAVFDNGSYEGLVLHSGCPLDYCVDTPVSITLDDLDIQCNHNHTGTLCGSCNNNYSIVFGTLHCIPCSNDHLALILPFALVGIVLVAIILLLQLSVAVGSLNGLIFYANVIQANRSIFFPPGKTNILTIFIAWLNLDLGIESCFYDGMTTYAFTWLQFVFPFYILLLIAVIIVASHYSSKFAKIFGNNPVAALATLILLSYSKILRVIILALSSATLEYPDGTNHLVWLYDGTVPYLQRFDHIVLGMFAILALLVLFLPYTFLLFFGHWLHAYSHWRIFSWLNKIKPFIDAYHAPYKRVTRYWTGLTLLLRCIFFMIFALNSRGNDGVNLLIVSSVSAGLATLAWMHHGLYAKLFNDILEGAFILNLCVFAAATYHVKQTGERQDNVANASVGVAFSAFIYILLYHAYISVSKTSIWKKILHPKAKQYLITLGLYNNKRSNEKHDGEYDNELQSFLGQAPTTSSIELRESLLET